MASGSIPSISEKNARFHDVPIRVRRRESDARWRANVASCFETLKNIIPVNKRASRRQISKAFVLQETSKHIHFLEGILTTLLQEKARENGKDPESYVESYDQIKADFCRNQKLKIQALSTEKRYKGNRYRLYMTERMAQSDGSQAMLGSQNKKVKAKGAPSGKLTLNPDLKNPRVAPPKPRKPRATLQSKQPKLRVILHPMKDALNRVRKPTEHDDYVRDLAEVLKSTPDPLHIMEVDSPLQTRYQPRKPKKLLTPAKDQKPALHPRPRVSVTVTHRAPQSIALDLSKKSIPYPEIRIESNKTQSTSAKKPFFYREIWPAVGNEETLGSSGSEDAMAQYGGGLWKDRSAKRFRTDVAAPGITTGQNQQLTGLKSGVSTPVLTSIHLNSTPAKRDYHKPSYSTPSQSGTSSGTPFTLDLTPISKSKDQWVHMEYSTPLKQIRSQTDVSPGFTPVVLPNDWMCTPTKSPATPGSSFYSDYTMSGHESLECDEAISSDDEDSTRRFGHSQAFQHRESKLHPVRTRHRTNSSQRDNRSTHERHDSCKRSLNMSMDIEADRSSNMIVGSDLWTEECLQDFDRYYEQLKEAKNSLEDDKDDKEKSGGVDEMWELVTNVSSPNIRPPSERYNRHTELKDYGNKVDGEQMTQDWDQMLCDYVGRNALFQEFMPLENMGALFSYQEPEEEGYSRTMPVIQVKLEKTPSPAKVTNHPGHSPSNFLHPTNNIHPNSNLSTNRSPTTTTTKSNINSNNSTNHNYSMSFSNRSITQNNEDINNNNNNLIIDIKEEPEEHDDMSGEALILKILGQAIVKEEIMEKAMVTTEEILGQARVNTGEFPGRIKQEREEEEEWDFVPECVARHEEVTSSCLQVEYIRENVGSWRPETEPGYSGTPLFI